ncbi:MAG: S9 family peptidase, partial [Acetatifactor sp.]|nr:S9 family peptidase [Acetatifactor sp.]
EHAHEIKGMILLFPALCVADNWNERFPSVDAIPQQYDVWGVPLGKSFFETLHGFDIFENIGKYSGNVLIMHGDKDDIVPVEYSERAREIYQNSRLEIFHGEGHGFSVAGNDKVIHMLIEFIISVGSSIC